MELLRDRIEGIDCAEVGTVVVAQIDALTIGQDEMGKRVDVLELDRGLTAEQVMLVSLDERLRAIERTDQELLGLLRRLCGEA